MARSRKQAVPLPALVLGLAGLIPFYLCALAAWLPSMANQLLELLPVVTLLGGDLSESASELRMRQLAIYALGTYGAVILSFLGGVRWGNLLSDHSQVRRWGALTLSVVPSLIAWPALMMPPIAMLATLSAGFVFQFALDVEAVRREELPGWFGRLRKILTTGAVLALLAGLLSVVIG